MNDVALYGTLSVASEAFPIQELRMSDEVSALSHIDGNGVPPSPANGLNGRPGCGSSGAVGVAWTTSRGC
jgi:hypothetical protein